MTRVAHTAPAVVQALWNEDPATESSDQQLLQEFLSTTDGATEAAFATLVERHGPIVHRVCLDVLGNLHDAQDAAQAVFLILARKARSIRKPESLGPWLHGVALRVARHARSEVARRTVAERRKSEITCQRDHAECGPEAMDHDDLHAEIDRLPEKYRLPMILCYMQGRTQPQAAQMLGWPLGTVQIRLHRGRERLRSRLSRTGTSLLALTGSDLTKSLSVPAVAFDRAWTETTARAAVQFAAGKATAGLVAPQVTGLASSVLGAMVGDSLKILALIATAALLVAAGLSLITSRVAEVPRQNSLLEPRTAKAASKINPQPTPIATSPENPTEIRDRNDQSRPSEIPAKLKTQTAERTPASIPGVPAPAPPPRDDSVVDVTVSKSLSSSDRSRNLTLLDRRSERSLRLGRELFERVWARDDPRGHGGDGLGPVFNGQSCVGCHNLGGLGGAGSIDRNIEIVTATGGNLADYAGFSYSFSMDFGAGKFEYRMGGEPQISSSRESQVDPRLAGTLHAGFLQSRSVVLHRFSTDPT
jgi:RNA polymerase sigma factor (sigma-70 family)